MFNGCFYNECGLGSLLRSGSHGVRGARAGEAAWRWFVQVLLFALTLLATPAMDAESARFSRLSVEEGLSQSSVESIAEDRYGFLWFGTQEGLNRFDGHRFIVHQASSGQGRLRDGFIRAIVPDPDGDLWIGTESGLQHLDVATGRFGESVSPPGIGTRLNTLLVAPDRRLWFSGIDGGLWTRAPRSGAVAQPIATEVITSSDTVSAVAFGASGNLWIAAHGDLFSLRIESRRDATVVTPTIALHDLGFVRTLHVEHDGVVWIGRQQGPPMRFDPETGETTEYSELPIYTLTITSASGGRLWIGGKDGGLTRFDPKTRERVTYRHEPGNEDSLAENDVAIAYQDRGGSLWVGAWNGGLSRLNLYAQAFRTLRNDPVQDASLPDNDVTQMVEGPDGRLWTMTRNDVVAAGDPTTGKFRTIPIERDVTSIAFSTQRFFVGSTSGLLELDPATERPVAASEALRAAGLDRMRIEMMHGTDEALWIVTAGSLFRLTRNEGAESLEHVALPFRGEPVSLFAPSPDKLWIAYAEGILLHAQSSKKGALTVRRVGDASLTARGRTTAVLEDRGVVWLGTARGLGRLAPSSHRVTWVDPEVMPSSSVAGILSDDSGALWIATNQGLTRFDPATDRTVHFGGVQGAQAWGYVDGGAARGDSGLFYFAGRGITVFDPRRVQDNPHRPRVLFTALETLHRPVLPSWRDEDSPLETGIHAASEVALGPDVVVFSVEMASPGASDPDHLAYVHRLDGFDTDWIETTADRRVATYTRLAPGRYLLRARARSQSGLWSEEEATLRIRILPPWWRTPAAIAVWCALLILAITAAAAETRRRTRMRIALAEQEALRRASVTDPLTGLYNRRFLASWLKHEVPRTLRTHRPRADGESNPEFLLIVMADLDNLKEINDAFGHDAGDRTIRAVADLLQSHARADDLAVRWGGDEFILIIRSVNRAQAADVVERLRASAESIGSALEDSPHSTISLGFASFPFLPHDIEALSWEQTLQLADRALLQSKRRGRNSWTGFVATPATSGDALLADLDAATDRPASAELEVVERLSS